MRCSTIIVFLCAASFVFPITDTAAQTPIAAVKALYLAASYEEALGALDTIESSEGTTLESSEYRILCLLALGKRDAARRSIAALVLAHPTYRADLSLMAPGVRAQFDDVRQQLLPQIVRREYLEAKARFDAKEYEMALQRFDLVLDVLDGAGDDAVLGDFRLLALSLRDRARDAIAQTRPIDPARDLARVAPANAVVVESPARVYDASIAGVVPPVPLTPILPPASNELSTATPGPGVFEILIDERGVVESAAVQRSISPRYDRLVLREARNWRYHPATHNGRAVRFRKVIEIYTAPLASIEPDRGRSATP